MWQPSTAGSASVDGLLCVWDLLTGACMYSIQVVTPWWLPQTCSSCRPTPGQCSRWPTLPATWSPWGRTAGCVSGRDSRDTSSTPSTRSVLACVVIVLGVVVHRITIHPVAMTCNQRWKKEEAADAPPVLIFHSCAKKKITGFKRFLPFFVPFLLVLA